MSVRSLLDGEAGQDLIEYALLASLIVVTMFGVVGTLGLSARGIWAQVASDIAATSP